MGAAPAAAARKALPTMTVGRFKEAAELIERLVAEKTDVFLQNANDYRRRHRDTAEPRTLTPQEAAQIAAAMAEVITGEEDPIAFAERVQASGLRAYHEPEPQEILLSAGLATAPALMDVVLRLVALVEMDPDVFKDAREGDELDAALDDHARELEELELPEARKRAVAALQHVQASTEAKKGEVWGLLVRLIVQAFSQAMATTSQSETSPTESSTASLVNTAGDGSTSSTEPPGETP